MALFVFVWSGLVFQAFGQTCNKLQIKEEVYAEQYTVNS